MTNSRFQYFTPALIALCLVAEADQKPSSLEFLKEVVAISSGTADLAGVNQVQRRYEARLQKLGFKTEYLENPEQHTKMLVGTFKGEDPRFITLVGHADTVFEKLNPFLLSADGKTAQGSGVSDDKGGVIVGLAALESFLTHGKPRFSVRMVISASEETDSTGFHDLLSAFSKDSVMILGLEPSEEDGSYVISRKGIRWYDIRVKGKEAHAGVNHQKGINACHELAIKIDQLQKLTDYRKGNTVSIGHIEGGKDKYNIVCGFAEAKVDSRYSDPREGQKLENEINAILKRQNVRSFETHEPTETEVRLLSNMPGFVVAREALPFRKKYEELLKQIEGRAVQGKAAGGGADLNYMYRTGIPILDGLGPIGGGFHTADEFIKIDSLETRAQALAGVIQYADQTLEGAKPESK